MTLAPLVGMLLRLIAAAIGLFADALDLSPLVVAVLVAAWAWSPAAGRAR